MTKKIYRVVRYDRPTNTVCWNNLQVLWEGSDLFDDYIDKIYNPRFDKPIRYGISFDTKIAWEVSKDGGKSWEEILPPKELGEAFSKPRHSFFNKNNP